MKARSIILAISWVVAAFFPQNCQAYRINPDQLRAELHAAGIKTGKTGEIGGVPYLEAELPEGKCLDDLCQGISLLKENTPEVFGVTAIANRLHPLLIRGGAGEPFTTQLKWLKIVLNTDNQPKNLPSGIEKRLVGSESHIIVDQTRQMLILYEFGQLKLLLPVLTGQPEKGNPPIKGIVLAKAEHLVDGDISLFWAVQFSPKICFYGGLMDGMRKGNVVAFLSDAEKLFKLVEAGKTSFEIR